MSLSAEQTATLAALLERLIPDDELGAGALACGALEYVAGSLDADGHAALDRAAGFAALGPAAQDAFADERRPVRRTRARTRDRAHVQRSRRLGAPLLPRAAPRLDGARPADRAVASADVVLIGLGGAGGIAADVLTQAGAEVVALEAGPRVGRGDSRFDEFANNVEARLSAPKALGEAPRWRTSSDEPRSARRGRC